jgi:hypothetical protein
MATSKKTGTAKKSSAARKRSAKEIPAVRHLRYNLTNSSSVGTETSHYLDIGRDLSALNRRLMRQGRVYHIKRVTIVSSNSGQSQGPSPGSAFATHAGRVSFSVIPTSWMTIGAWKRGFATWNKMNKQSVLSDQPSLKPRYHDFKLRGIGSYAPTPTYAVPVDNGGGAVSLGEWTYTKLVSPDGTTSSDDFDLHMLGGHIGNAGSRTGVALLKSFAETRATVQDNDPNRSMVDIDDPLLNLFDDGTVVDEVTNLLLYHNEDTPYDNDLYTGETGNMPQPLVVQDTTLGVDGKATVGGFAAMCGLVEVEIKSPIASDVYSVLVELAPGKYRGIKADVI